MVLYGLESREPGDRGLGDFETNMDRERKVVRS